MFACIAAVALCTGAVITVEAPAYAQPWRDAPARFLLEGVSPDRPVAMVDRVTGAEVACKVQQHRDQVYVFWTRGDDGAQARQYDIMLETAPTPAPPVFVGAGDMLDYGRRGVVADLGVGLWATPMPIDWDGDGNMDLLYSCQDVPQSGIYVYIQEEPGLFRRTKRLADGEWYPCLADLDGDGREDLLVGDVWYADIRSEGPWTKHEGPVKRPEYRVRSFMSRQVDWDGDGVNDIIAAAGDWRDYGWDRAFDETGTWVRGPLHGPLWFHRNTGTNEAPEYAEGVPLRADDKPIDVYGSPVPCIADWDGDGDLDLICGEFRDEFTYYENIGTRTRPILASPSPVMTRNGRLRIDLCMMSATVCDWNGDGRPDLLVGHEDGRVSVILNLGMSRGAPLFSEEFFLKELDPPLKSGGLVTPWVDPNTRDLYCGNTAGYIERFLWQPGGTYAEGRYLRTGREPFRVQAGYNLSIQGPAERKWGYTVPCLGDLNNDGTLEVVYNSIIGRIGALSVTRVGGVTEQPVRVAWPGDPPYPAWNWWKPEPGELVVQWRTRPVVVDWDKDGRNDLVAVDHEGYLALYRSTDTELEPGRRVFLDEAGESLRLNENEGGRSGRAKVDIVDWDGDGDLDILRNTENTGWFENVGDGRFAWRGDLPGRKLAGHTTAPHALDWNGDGAMDLIVGAEDGHIYCYHRAALDEPDRIDARAVAAPQ